MSPMFLNLNIGLKGYDPLQGHQSTPSAIHVQLEAASRRPRCCPHCQGTRLLGKALELSPYATVDASEQATNALPFYLSRGFRVVGRSETDPQGRPYPLIHLAR